MTRFHLSERSPLFANAPCEPRYLRFVVVGGTSSAQKPVKTRLKKQYRLAGRSWHFNARGGVHSSRAAWRRQNSDDGGRRLLILTGWFPLDTGSHQGGVFLKLKPQGSGGKQVLRTQPCVKEGSGIAFLLRILLFPDAQQVFPHGILLFPHRIHLFPDAQHLLRHSRHLFPHSRQVLAHSIHLSRVRQLLLASSFHGAVASLALAQVRRGGWITSGPVGRPNGGEGEMLHGVVAQLPGCRKAPRGAAPLRPPCFVRHPEIGGGQNSNPCRTGDGRWIGFRLRERRFASGVAFV